MMKVSGWLRNAAEGIRHIFFPHICAGCGSDLLREKELLCIRCLRNLPFTNFHRYRNNPVEKIFWGRIPLVAAFSFMYFTKNSILQQLMHQLKYSGRKEIGDFFGRKMGEVIPEFLGEDLPDAIIPLPLHPAKERKRGYNQAGIIAKGISSITNIPVKENVVRRDVYTFSQTQKSRIERWDNMEGKFVLNEDDVPYGKHVLLVDDVITTGATLESCGAELLKVEGLRLSISTLAYSTR
jgi:ComF family protein